MEKRKNSRIIALLMAAIMAVTMFPMGLIAADEVVLSEAVLSMEDLGVVATTGAAVDVVWQMSECPVVQSWDGIVTGWRDGAQYSPAVPLAMAGDGADMPRITAVPGRYGTALLVEDRNQSWSSVDVFLSNEDMFPVGTYNVTIIVSTSAAAVNIGQTDEPWGTVANGTLSGGYFVATYEFESGGAQRGIRFAVTANIDFTIHDIIIEAEECDGENGGGTVIPGLPAPAVPGAPSLGAPAPTEINEDAVTVETIQLAGSDVNVRIVAGRAVVQLPARVIRDMVEDAGNNGEVTFDLSGLDIVSAAVSRFAFRQFAAAGLRLEVILPQGTMALDAEAVDFVATRAHTANVVFRIQEILETQKPLSLLAVLPAGATVHQTAISAGSRTFRDFEDGSLSVSLPAAAASQVFAVVPGIRLVRVPSTVAGGEVTFDTSGLGLFVVSR